MIVAVSEKWHTVCMLKDVHVSRVGFEKVYENTNTAGTRLQDARQNGNRHDRDDGPLGIVDLHRATRRGRRDAIGSCRRPYVRRRQRPGCRLSRSRSFVASPRMRACSIRADSIAAEVRGAGATHSRSQLSRTSSRTLRLTVSGWPFNNSAILARNRYHFTSGKRPRSVVSHIAVIGCATARKSGNLLEGDKTL